MATMMFESSLSMSSSMRPPLLSSAAHHAPSLSMADSLPSINCNFDDLRERMASFSERFEDFIARGRRRLLEEHNQFKQTVAELQEDQRLKKKDLDILAHKIANYEHSLGKEAAETAEMRAAITSITKQRDDRAAHRDRIRSEIAATQKLIGQRVQAQQQYAKELDMQARSNGPELAFWMDCLCLRIEGGGTVDRIKFVFDHVDERDWDREVWFMIDTERRDYRIETIRPKLDVEEVERCLERFNENRELGTFLKGMRNLFVAAMR